MVRIPGSHPGGPGSIPGMGSCFFETVKYAYTYICNKLLYIGNHSRKFCKSPSLALFARKHLLNNLRIALQYYLYKNLIISLRKIEVSVNSCIIVVAYLFCTNKFWRAVCCNVIWLCQASCVHGFKVYQMCGYLLSVML